MRSVQARTEEEKKLDYCRLKLFFALFKQKVKGMSNEQALVEAIVESARAQIKNPEAFKTYTARKRHYGRL